jgi:hypothetical protein
LRVSGTAANLDGTAVLDANQPESYSQGAELLVAMLPKSGKIVSLQMASRIHVDHFELVTDMSTAAAPASQQHAYPRTPLVDFADLVNLVNFIASLERQLAGEWK